MMNPNTHNNCRFLPTSEDGGFHGNSFCELPKAKALGVYLSHSLKRRKNNVRYRSKGSCAKAQLKELW